MAFSRPGPSPSPELIVPDAFASGIIADFGDNGRDWLARLPDLVQALCRDWRLAVEGAPLHGHLGLVVPVRRGDEPLMLKVAMIEPSSIHERLALAAWNGRGAVRLLDARPDDGALLLERLDAARSLAGVPLDEAAPVAARLLRRLAIRAPAGFPHQHDVAMRIADTLPDRWERQGGPFPASLLHRAVGLARELARPVAERLVNYDLHDENILAGTREPWLAIDPKVIAGDPEYGVAQYLWRRLDEMADPAELRRHLERIVAVAALDPERTSGWAIVRVVDYWLWALSIGLTEDPRRCATLLTWLSESDPI